MGLIKPIHIEGHWLSVRCPLPLLLKQMKKLFNECGLYLTKAFKYKVSDSIVIGWVWQGKRTGVQIPQACCVHCRSLFGGNSHSNAPFNFCPNVRVHPGAPMLGWGMRQGGGVVGLKIAMSVTPLVSCEIFSEIVLILHSALHPKIGPP